MAAITLTPEQLVAMNPCGIDDRLKMFGRRKSLNSKQALEAGATVCDILWVAGRLGRRDLCVKFALLVAQRAAQYSKDPRVQACLDATSLYVAEPTLLNLEKLREARRAAYADAAADAAAYAAYAYAAYAYAAYAAYADASYADASYTDAAYAAARKKEIAAQHELLIEVFG